MSAETDTQAVEPHGGRRDRPYFVHIPQHKDWKHLSEVPYDFWLWEYEAPCVGRASYVVLEDGCLQLVEHNWDSTGD